MTVDVRYGVCRSPGVLFFPTGAVFGAYWRASIPVNELDEFVGLINAKLGGGRGPLIDWLCFQSSVVPLRKLTHLVSSSKSSVASDSMIRNVHLRERLVSKNRPE